MATRQFTVTYSKKPLDFLAWVLISSMEFFFLFLIGFALAFFKEMPLDDILNLLLPIYPIFLFANLLFHLYNRKKLKVKLSPDGLSFVDAKQKAVHLRAPIRYNKVWSYSFIEQTNINISINPAEIGAKRGHSTTEVLSLILMGSDGEMLVLSKELPPWSQSPGDWEYLDNSNFHPKHHYSVSGFYGVLAKLEGALEEVLGG